MSVGAAREVTFGRGVIRSRLFLFPVILRCSLTKSASLEGRRPQLLGRSCFEARLRSHLRMTGEQAVVNKQTPRVPAFHFSRG
jgi:hypothetical protein